MSGTESVIAYSDIGAHQHLALGSRNALVVLERHRDGVSRLDRLLERERVATALEEACSAGHVVLDYPCLVRLARRGIFHAGDEPRLVPGDHQAPSALHRHNPRLVAEGIGPEPETYGSTGCGRCGNRRGGEQPAASERDDARGPGLRAGGGEDPLPELRRWLRPLGSVSELRRGFAQRDYLLAAAL